VRSKSAALAARLLVDVEVRRDGDVRVVRDLVARVAPQDVDDEVLRAVRVDEAKAHRERELVGVVVEAER
jgi:hypothetical protein